MTIRHFVPAKFERPPWYKKINPIWWLGNDFEPTPPDWYFTKHHPRSPRWWAIAMWYVRNPFHNFGRYVFGLTDRAFYVCANDARYALSTHKREDWINDGRPGPDPGPWNFHWLEPAGARWLKLPYVAYDSPRLRFYTGWQHWGFFGFKLYPKGSPVQVA